MMSLSLYLPLGSSPNPAFHKHLSKQQKAVSLKLHIHSFTENIKRPCYHECSPRHRASRISMPGGGPQGLAGAFVYGHLLAPQVSEAGADSVGEGTCLS